MHFDLPTITALVVNVHPLRATKLSGVASPRYPLEAGFHPPMSEPRHDQRSLENNDSYAIVAICSIASGASSAIGVLLLQGIQYTPVYFLNNVNSSQASTMQRS
jgi:hypothetical protein